MIKAVVFDLDDTLAPEYSFVKSGYRAVAQKIEDDMDAISGFIGDKNDSFSAESIYQKMWELFLQDHANVFNRLLDSMGIAYEREDILSLVKLYREHKIDSEIYKCYEDAFPVLDSLREKGIKLGILSDGFLVSQKAKANVLNLDSRFDFVVFTEELGQEYRKPSKKGFLLLCEKLGCEIGEMLYVGDNPEKDFFVKKELPEIKTARIVRKDSVYECSEYRENIKEDYLIKDLYSVLEII